LASSREDPFDLVKEIERGNKKARAPPSFAQQADWQQTKGATKERDLMTV
jgi:hypothetical protein